MQFNKSLIIFALSLIVLFLLKANNVLAVFVPLETKSAVVFLYAEIAGKDIPYGTGFFVGIKNPTNANISYAYLVTARHVLCKPKSNEFLEKIYVRINTTNGGSEKIVIPIIIEGNNRTVFTHTDASVDIAVIPFFPDPNKFDFKIIPEEFIATLDTYKMLKIREGSEVFFTGLFSPYQGTTRNYPIIRFGRVALVTDEKIEWMGKLMDLYLIEAGSYGGNSGSPVFFNLGNDREPNMLIVGPPVIKLAGIMQGTFRDIQEIQIIETNTTPISYSSMGIAAVVPAYKLYELLFSDELKHQRGF